MLLTKLHIPQIGENIIPRSNLFEKLNEGLNRKLILVSAPAGYGKTILLSDWITKHKIPTAWFSIDKRDNDLVNFLEYIIIGIQNIKKDCGNGSLKLLKSPKRPDVESIVSLLINDILKIEQNFVLILDDFHLIENKEVQEAVSFLIEYCPNQMHIAILTRSDPTLPIARLRSQNELTEIRSSDLNFSTNDIYTFFNKKLKLELSNNDITLLQRKTEGWIAGLQLTAISMQGRVEISGFINELAKDNRYIMDYLIEEVLNIQTEEVKEFLLKTSVLKMFSASLCDFLLQKDKSRFILESLEKNNMFIVPLDPERKWFRYHHLFADLLKQRLVYYYKEEIKEIHRKASAWFEENGLITESIEHTLEAGNEEKALQLLESIVEELWENGQYTAILNFGEYFTEETIIANPKFGIFYTWILITAGRIAEAENILQKTEQKLIKTQHSLENNDVLGKLSIAYALLYVLQGNMKKVIKYSELAISNLSDKNPLWNGWAYLAFGDAYLMNGNFKESKKSYQQALDYSKKASNVYLQITASYKLAFCLGVYGKFKSAFVVCKEQIDLINDFDPDQTLFKPYAAGLYSLYGLIHTVWNNLEEGTKNIEIGYELSKKANDISLKVFSHLMVVSLHYTVGKLPDALKILKELESDPEFKQTSPWLSIHVTGWKAGLYIELGEIELASKILERYEKKLDTEINKKIDVILLRLTKLYIAKSEIDKAVNLLESLSEHASKINNIYLSVSVNMLKTKVYKLINKDTEAKESLINAVLQAQNEGYIRVFINEGQIIEEFLKIIKKEKSTKSTELLNSISSDFLNTLIESFEKENILKKYSSDEVLSSRELDTLKLIAENLTNQEIADQLFISITTVKTHVRNILLKLEAKNRNEAVTKAKEKGIL